MGEQKRDLIEWAISDIRDLFVQNGLQGSMLHGFFEQCLEDKTMDKFYIDDRVPFKGKRKLYALVDGLIERGY
jgi:hypothetical protein